MSPSQLLTAALNLLLLLFLSLPKPTTSWRPWPNTTNPLYTGSKKYEGSSEFVKLKYHMGPVLTSNITIYPIWYGQWTPSQKHIILDFLSSLSTPTTPTTHTTPSVSTWWKTVQQYTDQTGSNISSSIHLGPSKNDRFYSHGKSLTRLSIQSVIKTAITSSTNPLPINSNGLILLLTSQNVYVENFCDNVCGFHYFTFPSIVGYTLPYAWVGNSGKYCPEVCAYPFAVPAYMSPGMSAVKTPNGDIGVDGMISVIAHEIAEVASDPMVNGWYAGGDPVFPVEIADLCEGIYGTGGGGSYTGQMLSGEDGAVYNMVGVRRRFLVQWVWNHVLNYCSGPNALD